MKHMLNLYLLGGVMTLLSIFIGLMESLEACWRACLLGAPGPPEVSLPTQSPQGPSRPSIQRGVIRPPSTGYNLGTVSKIPPALPVPGQASCTSVLSEN
ncbi:hypothetical protein M91_17747 [Bos mutus]|uniref:Uncharacterized protein n=2 Tax=Bos TaxID=9903 RepID=L8IMV3_9CETA|nr:hypothetical protein M91_17747 [Bos mutus]